MNTSHPDPRDGFRAILQRTQPGVTELQVHFYVNGDSVEWGYFGVRMGPRTGPQAIAGYTEPLTPEEEAERLRAFYLFEAFCRYLNTGGSPSNFGDYAARMRALLSAAPVLDLSAWTYHSTGPVQTPVDHGVWEGQMRFGHTFVPNPADPNAQALYWEEPDGSDGLVGGLIELFPVKELEDDAS